MWGYNITATGFAQEACRMEGGWRVGGEIHMEEEVVEERMRIGRTREVNIPPTL